MYSNSKFTKKLYPAITDVNDFLKYADVNDIEGRDCRPLMFLLMRMASASPRISGLINTRFTSIKSYQWSINANDDSLNEKAVQTRNRCIYAINKIIDKYLDCVLYGIMAVKYKYEYLNGEWAPSIIEYFKPIQLDYELDNLVIVNEDNNQKTIIQDKTEYFWHIKQSYTRGGILRSIIFHELLRNETMLEWANLNKRMKGIIMGIIDAEKLSRASSVLSLSDDQVANSITELDTALQNAGENNYLKAHNYIDIQLKSIVEAAAGGSYAEFKKVLENDIAIALLGQANMTELPSGSGSRAALQVQNLIRQDILFADLVTIKEMINEFLLIDYKMNFDKNALASPFEFDFVFDENIDIETNARVFETIARSGINLDVSKNEVYAKLGLSVPLEGEKIIKLSSSSNNGTFL